MKIHKLSIGNFRCFTDIEIALHPDFNILIGNNAAGKTALLEALTVALGGWLSGIGGVDARPLRERDDVRRVSRSYGREITFEPQYPTEIAAEGEVLGERIAWTRFLSGPGGATRLGGEPIRELAEEMARRVRGGEALTAPVIAYYGAGRLAGDPPASKRTRTSLEQLDLSRLEGYRDAVGSGRVSPRVITLWLEYQDRIAYTERLESPLYNAVRQAITQMIPNARETRFDPKIRELVMVFDDNFAHPFSELSDGQRGVAAVAADIAIRMTRLNPHLAEAAVKQTPGVILIDELDLHLHPEWQREVVSRLRTTFPEVQFITTTHSPQILGEVEPDCIRVITKDEQGAVATFTPTQSYGLDTIDVLESLMHAPTRAADVQKMIESADEYIENGDLQEARKMVDGMRLRMHGDAPETARLEGSINNLEALVADAVD